MTDFSPRTISTLRTLGWGSVMVFLALPAIAMARGAQGVHWTASDFILAAALLGGLGLGFELAVRRTRNRAYLLGCTAALLTGFATFWANLAVGIVGEGPNAANLLAFALVPGAILGAILVRFEPQGMAKVALGGAATMVAALGLALGTREVTTTYAFLGAAACGWLVAAAFFRAASGMGENRVA